MLRVHQHIDDVWSHPARVRGLKHRQEIALAKLFASHPARVRGLKQAICRYTLPTRCVAPRAGAWIETVARERMASACLVAPRAGAWIETSTSFFSSAIIHPSHPARVRGLKLFGVIFIIVKATSHPARVRGLKLPVEAGDTEKQLVAPRAGAWIETSMISSR